MTETVDKAICGCPPPDHLSKFAKFVWMCYASDEYLSLEDLIELRTALEYWEEFRSARTEGCTDRMQRAAMKFAELWPSFEPADALRLTYPTCLNNGSLLSYPDSLEEWLVATYTPDPWGFSDLKR